jgi:superfamily II DNA or RNA helicase
VSTDASDVRRFLEKPSSKVKIVFSTYQSSPIVAEGARGLNPFDIAVFDEAHKTTGPQAGLFATALHDEKIKIEKRLFLTATPRHYQLGNRDKDGDLKFVSMDDEAIYGPRAYTLTFGQAARQGIICDYRVIVAVVEGAEVNQFRLQHGITLVDGEQIGASWVAKQIAVQRAVEETAAKRAISFHSRVSMAKEFSSDSARGIGQYLEGFTTFHANGEQKSFERKQILNGFRDAPKALITNARCLTEGIDIPAVDMVAFVDPRSSRVDIAQAAGRAMRKPRNSDKTVGYVVVPLFVERDEGETIDEALERTNYVDVMAVLNAMREQDDELTDIIQQLRQASGRGEIFNPKPLAEKVQILGPEVSLEVLQASIFAQIVEQVGDSWDSWFGRLQAFKSREGHCRVPGNALEGKFKLGGWVGEQRKRSGMLSEGRRTRLDALGFVWDPYTEQWENGFKHLEAFKAREGHCRVALDAFEGEFRLGQWVGVQRSTSDKLSEDRRTRLDALGFVWDPFTDLWENGFKHLEAFKAREGHCRVPTNALEGDFRLGNWVNNWRTKREELTEDRRTRLDALGFVWDPYTEQWEHGFKHLEAFKAREGHCRVAQGTLEGEFRLGQWASEQRKRSEKLSEDRRTRLDALGFVWDPITEQWEDGFLHLEVFKAREGHCRVAQGTLEGELRLGDWVSTQRKTINKLSEGRRTRLDALGFVWDPITEQWEDGFLHLENFQAHEGHCRVPTDTLEGEFRLGQWVSQQRKTGNKLSEDRRTRLDALGFVWDPYTEQWEDGFKHLEAFKAREGHCRVAKGTLEGGYRLGQWVSKQRVAREELTEDRRTRLDALGFVWDPYTEQWENGFKHLEAFKAREGHCRVTQGALQGGFGLGQWVAVQRRKREQLPEERRTRLDALGFVWVAR